MEIIEQQRFIGERALFKSDSKRINFCTFAEGESPLKESSNLEINNTLFEWKYPLWYCKNIKVNKSNLFETGRSGIWYSHNIYINDTTIEAPKTFRQSGEIILNNVTMPKAEETLWNCRKITMNNVAANGDYFGMNSADITASDFRLTGNYAFDGGRNITVRNAKMISKDAFWNCENVTVYDSFIAGEYLGWNSKNITFINCTIESRQGMCYMENLVLKNSHLINTTLAFEYSTVQAEILGKIDSIKNPVSGRIKADSIDEIIFDDPLINKSKTQIEVIK